MAIVIESTSKNETWNAGSIVITKPTGLAVGDLMVAIIAKNNEANDISGPGGWTKYGEDAATFTEVASFYKFADSGDVAASNFTFTTTTFYLAGIIYRISGASTTPTIQIASGADSTSISVSLTPISTSTALILYTLAGDNGGRVISVSGQSVTGSPTFTERTDIQNTALGNDVSFSCADATISNQTTITNISLSVSSAVDRYIVILLAFGARVDAAGTSALLSNTAPVFFTEAAVEVGTGGTAALLEASPQFFEATGRVREAEAEWTDQERGSGTWTDQTK